MRRKNGENSFYSQLASSYERECAYNTIPAIVIYHLTLITFLQAVGLGTRLMTINL